MKSNLDKKSEETTESLAKSETMQNDKEDTGTDHTGEILVSLLYTRLSLHKMSTGIG